MAALDSYEEEQVEAIKKWWQENGAAVVLGVALGVALLFGWRAWQNYTQARAEAGSNMYEQIVALAQQDKPTEAREVAQKLLSEEPGGNYAVLASLLLAGLDVKDNQLDAALARLDWVAQHAKLPELQQLAKLRKARVLFTKGDQTGALALAEGDAGSFKAAYAELEGDIYVAQGQPDAARKAYAAALEEKTLQGAQREWVQMKLDNLGPSAEADASSIVQAAFVLPEPAPPAPAAVEAPPAPAAATPPADAPPTP